MPKENEDDFVKADNTFPMTPTTNLKSATTGEPLNGEIMPVDMNNVPDNMMEHRANLLSKYYGGPKSLAEKLKKEGRNDLQSLVVALLAEMMEEGDSLQGNKMIALSQGQLRDATIISDKRAGVIEKIIKAAMAKQELEKERGEFDLDSPALRIVFRYFMERVKEAFKRVKLPDEQSDIFFTELHNVMGNWKGDLKEEFESLNTIGGDGDGKK